MLAKRTLVVIILLPLGLAVIYLGGLAFTVTAVLLAGLAGWEYVRMMRAGGYQPALVFVAGGAILLIAGRAWNEFASAPLILSLVILGSMTYHLVDFERGRLLAGADFGVTLGGALYLGWMGAYLISLRNLPDGLGWMSVVLPAVWFADSGAYLIGSRFGRHPLAPRLSPKKTWEGYWGGVAGGVLGGAGLALAWQAFVAPGGAITPARGALLGLLLALLTPLGDLGESMFKRQVGMKDSGALLPGHGGAFDRIDSWLWAGVIGYYLVTWFF